MSASNWGVCPKCLAVHEEKQRAKMQDVRDQYGKIAPEAWIEAKSKAEEQVDLDNSLREDYELGITEQDGNFYVIYKARCVNDGCDLVFEYRYEKQVYTKPVGSLDKKARK